MNHLTLGLQPFEESIMDNTNNEEMEVEIFEKLAPDSWSWKDYEAITSIKEVP